MAEDSGEQKASGDTRTVFISYASQDAAAANSIVESLERHGLKCWLAPRDVKPGAQYADAIVGAINEAKSVVLLLSQSAVSSSHVGREVERAASKRKPIIAFRVDAAALNRALEYFLSESQWIDVPVIGMPAALTKLKEAVEQGSAQAGAAGPAESAKPLARTGGRAKLIATGAVVITAGVAAVVGLHFWSQSHKAAPPAAAVAITDKSIAVLPFVDMSDNKDQEYFADGMAEELLDLLANIPGLKVISRTSSFQFKGKNQDLRVVGKTLGVSYVVEGSVRKSGGRLRVTAQLINAQDGSHLWSDTYDEPVSDTLKVQDQIASNLAPALQVTVGADYQPERPSFKSAEAYDLYLRGRHAFDRFDKAGFNSAAAYFQQVLELDSSSIPAAEWLAFAQEMSAEFGYVEPREGFERARRSAQRALGLDPKSSLAYVQLSAVHLIYDWDWAGAERDAKEALRLKPRDPIAMSQLAQAYVALGRWDESADLLEAALALDPLFAGWHDLLSGVRYSTGRLGDAEAEARKILEISPTYDGGHSDLGYALLAQGKTEAALTEMQQEPTDSSRDSGLAIVYHAMGRRIESDAALTELIREHPQDGAYQIALVYAHRHELDRGFTWLESAYRQKDPQLLYIKEWERDRLLKNFTADARYTAFLRKMNLRE